MGKSETWSSPGINFRAFAFHIYIYVCTIISSKNFYDFSTISQTVLSHMSKWFTSNKLVLNLDKINVIKFITNKSPQYDLNIFMTKST
jgi:hypothetical protein